MYVKDKYTNTKYCSYTFMFVYFRIMYTNLICNQTLNFCVVYKITRSTLQYDLKRHSRPCMHESRSYKLTVNQPSIFLSLMCETQIFCRRRYDSINKSIVTFYKYLTDYPTKIAQSLCCWDLSTRIIWSIDVKMMIILNKTP